MVSGVSWSSRSPDGVVVDISGLSKRGDRYLRTLLIHWARARLRFAARKRDPRSRWISAMRERRGTNIAAVALANKNARVLWALLAHNADYRTPAAA